MECPTETADGFSRISSMPAKLEKNRYAYLADQKLTLDPGESAFLLNGTAMYWKFRKAGLLKPVVNKNKIVLFKREDVKRCERALAMGEVPEMEEALPTPKSSKQAASKLVCEHRG